jgi:hypothetical protein
MSRETRTSEPLSLDFSSYNLRNKICSKHRGVKNTRGVSQNLKLRTKPSLKAVAKHKTSPRRILIKFKKAPIGSVMKRLSSRAKR